MRTPRGFADPRGSFVSPSLSARAINSPVKQTIVTLDLEGVLVPEIWIAVAVKTGIEALRRTTRDEPDYDVLMRYRLDLLAANNLKLSDIQSVIDTLELQIFA